MVRRQDCFILNSQSVPSDHTIPFYFLPSHSNWQFVNLVLWSGFYNVVICSQRKGKPPPWGPCLAWSIPVLFLVWQERRLPDCAGWFLSASLFHPQCTLWEKKERQMDSIKQSLPPSLDLATSPLKLTSPCCLLKPSRKQFTSCSNNISLHSCHTCYSGLSNHSTNLNEFLQSSWKRD